MRTKFLGAAMVAAGLSAIGWGAGMPGTADLAAQAPGQAAPGQGRAGGGGGRGGRGAAAEPVVPVHPRDLSGYWMLPPDPRDGRHVPEASLVATVTRQRLAQVAQHDRDAVRYCNQIGMPAMMGLGTPYNIKISPTLMVIVTEYAAAQNRWIYLNRDKHIPAEDYEFGVYGDSIARWDGNTLIVETTMQDPQKGILSIPGGGFLTAESKLVERFRLLKNGQVLSVVSTWTDPKVFRTPHSYEYRYNRMTRDYEGRLGSGCDPYDDERTAFLSAPPRPTP
jgi:hypothetical protein